MFRPREGDAVLCLRDSADRDPEFESSTKDVEDVDMEMETKEGLHEARSGAGLLFSHICREQLQESSEVVGVVVLRGLLKEEGGQSTNCAIG